MGGHSCSTRGWSWSTGISYSRRARRQIADPQVPSRFPFGEVRRLQSPPLVAGAMERINHRHRGGAANPVSTWCHLRCPLTHVSPIRLLCRKIKPLFNAITNPTMEFHVSSSVKQTLRSLIAVYDELPHCLRRANPESSRERKPV